MTVATVGNARALADRAFETRIVENAMMKRVREIRRRGVYPYYAEQVPVGMNHVEIDGRKMLQLGSSNYLGLAADGRVKDAVVKALDDYGTSCTSSRLLTGTRPLHDRLEKRLASFLGKEAALVFATGYLANVGGIPALVGRHDAVFYDAEVHACVYDGIALSGADATRFRHNDTEHLAQLLKQTEAPRKLIVVDSLYSLNGDLAPLNEIVDLGDKYGAWVFLDDAHGMGVIGPGGRGLAASCGVSDRVPVIMGVFSKSFASTGGFIAGSADLIDHLRFNARSHLFSNAIAPAQAAAALASLSILEAEPERGERAMHFAENARTRLRAIGWRVGGDGSQMVPIFIGNDWLAFDVTNALRRYGVNVSPAVSPGVPRGRDLLSVGFPPSLNDAEMEEAFAAFEKVALEIPQALEPHDEPGQRIAV
ncbi:MAG: aminotransferase class I/II-fold pyridoxal phosphate-dependent enzyme [Pseudomonadota bacterium]